jgi:hypothetical protein
MKMRKRLIVLPVLIVAIITAVFAGTAITASAETQPGPLTGHWDVVDLRADGYHFSSWNITQGIVDIIIINETIGDVASGIKLGKSVIFGFKDPTDPPDMDACVYLGKVMGDNFMSGLARCTDFADVEGEEDIVVRFLWTAYRPPTTP